MVLTVSILLVCVAIVSVVDFLNDIKIACLDV